MLDRLEILDDDEYTILLDSIPLITILIAGADDNIDTDERAWAEKITRIRSYEYHNELKQFYLKVGENFSERLDEWIQYLPDNLEKRQEEISAELQKINPVFDKVEEGIAHVFYKSLLSFARHVARASGGIAGFGSISPEEAELIDLPMIEPRD